MRCQLSDSISYTSKSDPNSWKGGGEVGVTRFCWASGWFSAAVTLRRFRFPKCLAWRARLVGDGACFGGWGNLILAPFGEICEAGRRMREVDSSASGGLAREILRDIEMGARTC